MNADVKPRRKYESASRHRQAEQTRSAVLDAAWKLFGQNGWERTTIAAIAREAAVSKETIYAVWGAKTAILADLAKRAVRGAAPETPLLDQDAPRAAIEGATAAEKIERFAATVTEILGRIAPIVDVARAAAQIDGDSAVLYRSLHEGRRRNLNVFAASLAPDLRAGLSVSDANEELWRLASPELYLLLIKIGGMTADAYAEWLAQSIKALVLGPH
ncbi:MULTISPECIES: TetR/AcrR family transcriptional regulator [unclassified Mesorhizobium]|uniref:TetR/AcrR family transcriptional regulator n=1 Tax=unclassified Mesorhizobium TaxID=325217 RepID=UPI0003CEE09F|nr:MULTISPECIES: TetR/AcrR family transcriptional regulator [unclassified Mesorhizobium]ESY56095.1 TetR family transcriptional regulator [Mesorhizobium sp. LNJC374B00]ESY61170.1 TetR family transcriptional regulator [Mesorhizobium sp. LNJC372A00]WJI78785.1 TetR/AcrR family transcriptional regulator [Mesorhizobium sp. C374B]WJI80822.1 TetR/AcrR family transcriptional regulator [Mesorhizobium sp. C374B]WJI85320.1 TetR/AcrR family transcriptional regulator [Mesorhizobium sp. C372A]